MTIREQLNSIAQKRVLILDGAMGSMIQTLNLNEADFRGGVFAGHSKPLKGCNDLLCLTKPEIIAAIHNAYLEAGADIIETCSFNATAVSLSDYGLADRAYEISAAAAKIARNAADKYSVSDKPRFVAGSIGPTAKGASLYPDINDPSKRGISWDELEAAYYDNARGLLDGGADILLVETVFDTLNAKAALFAISRLLEERGAQERGADAPVMISATVSGESGRLLSGQTLEAFCISVMHANPWAIGLNCSFGAEKMLPHIRQLADIAPCMISAHPNAGFPNQLGIYEETPECMAAHIETYLKEGLVNIVGGCCGSTPAHIAAIAAKAEAALAAAHKPRSLLDISRSERLAGLEPLMVNDDPVRAGDSQEYLRLAQEGAFEDAVDEMRDIVDAGAVILEIALDDEETMGKLMDYALFDPYVAKVPFMLSSAHWGVIESGLKRLQGRCLAKSINLKDGEEAFLRKAALIRRYGAAAVVTLVDEQGEAMTADRQIAIAERVCKLLEDVVFAPNLPTESFCSWVRENCLGALVLL